MRGDRRVVAKPRVVAPAVKPDVPDGRGSLRRGRKRTPDDGLVDVAETDAAVAQEIQRFSRIPRRVANFDDQWIVSEALENSGEIRHRLRSAMKRKRELQQNRAEPVRRPKHIEARANGALLQPEETGSVAASPTPVASRPNPAIRIAPHSPDASHRRWRAETLRGAER